MHSQLERDFNRGSVESGLLLDLIEEGSLQANKEDRRTHCEDGLLQQLNSVLLQVIAARASHHQREANVLCITEHCSREQTLD